MLVPVILSGGNGTRLWPVSREAHPKPFIRLNNDPFSLLQKTYLRAINLPNIERIITVTNHEYYYQTQKQLNELINLPKNIDFNFLLEPFSRNTAPAIALSAMFAYNLISPDAVLLVLPADHNITNQAKFNRCVQKAYQLAKKNLLITFGIIPLAPEISYGYMQYSKKYEEKFIYKVIQFHEKPTLQEAKLFIEEGNYLWNSGIFCFCINTFINLLKKHAYNLYLMTLKCWDESTKNNSILTFNNEKKFKLDEKSYFEIDNTSIDYAIMEKAQNIVTIPAEFGWSDIGSWSSLNSLIKPDKKGNRIVGNAILQKSHNTTIYNQSNSSRIIAGIGLNNLTIIDTNDGLLISDQTHLQQVKQLVAKLKQKGYKAYRYHQTVYRPWGHYIILDHGPNYKLKRLIVHPGASLSLQMHQFRSEYWMVIQGIATIQNNTTKLILKPQESTFIPIGSKHCLSNLEMIDLVIIELQMGTYLEEDDIIRFKDNYDRVSVNEKQIII